MGKKPTDKTKFDVALAGVPKTVPLHLAFQSACGQAGGKVSLDNDGLSCTLPSRERIKLPIIEGPG